MQDAADCDGQGENRDGDAETHLIMSIFSDLLFCFRVRKSAE